MIKLKCKIFTLNAFLLLHICHTEVKITASKHRRCNGEKILSFGAQTINKIANTFVTEIHRKRETPPIKNELPDVTRP